MSYVCDKCGGKNVQAVMWVNPDTGEVGEDFGSWGEESTKYCTDCDEHVKLVEVQDVPDVKQAAIGVFRLQPENPSSAYCRLGLRHELIVHKSDEGIVLDVWEDDSQDGPVWSLYHSDSEMLPDSQEE